MLIEYIKVSDLRKIRRQYLQLNDILTRLEIDIEGGQMTDLDFFRFRRTLRTPLSDDMKRRFKRKFRRNVLKLYK